MSSRRLHQRISIPKGPHLPSECLVTRFAPDGSMLAAGFGDGSIRIFHPRSGTVLYTLVGGGLGGSSVGGSSSLPAAAVDAYPVTALRWRSGASNKTKNVLIAAYADGSIKHWHVTSGKALGRAQAPDQTYCLDSRPDGEQYATGGKDKCVHLHDDTTGSVLTSFRPSGGFDTSASGHSNRIFGLKYHPLNENVIVSGGWDNTVLFWDARQNPARGGAYTSIFGPHICGDSLDIHGHTVLTGSWRPEKQLQLWDDRFLRKNEPVCDIPWSMIPAGSGSSAALATRMASKGAPCLLYAAQFSASGAYIAAGGSGSNEAKVFDSAGTLVHSTSSLGGRDDSAIPGMPPSDPSSVPVPETPSLPPPFLCGTIAGLTRSVYSVSFDGDSAVAISGGDFLLVMDVSPPTTGTAAAAGWSVSAGASSAAGGGKESEAEDLSSAFITSVSVGDSSSGGKHNSKNLALSKAEEDALAAVYGGEEEDTPGGGDDGEEEHDADAHNPAARFGGAISR